MRKNRFLSTERILANTRDGRGGGVEAYLRGDLCSIG